MSKWKSQKLTFRERLRRRTSRKQISLKNKVSTSIWSPLLSGRLQVDINSVTSEKKMFDSTWYQSHLKDEFAEDEHVVLVHYCNIM